MPSDADRRIIAAAIREITELALAIVRAGGDGEPYVTKARELARKLGLW